MTPSDLFSFNDPNPPDISRFLPGQRFDLQATSQPDTGTLIAGAKFVVDGVDIPDSVMLTLALATVASLPANTVVATLRAYANSSSGVHNFAVLTTDNKGVSPAASGNFEAVSLGNATDAKIKISSS